MGAGGYRHNLYTESISLPSPPLPFVPGSFFPPPCTLHSLGCRVESGLCLRPFLQFLFPDNLIDPNHYCQ